MFNVNVPYRYNRPHKWAQSITTRQDFALVFHTVDQSVVVTKHSVQDNKMDSGIVVDPIAVIENAVEKTSNNESQHFISPSNVLINNRQILCWHRKATLQPMWFRLQGKRTVNLRVWWPNLVFMCHIQTRELYVYATATGGRPNPKTMLYKAPFMNISNNGKLCLGTAILPEKLDINTMSLIESALFDSCFSNNHMDENDRYLYTQGCNRHMQFYRERQRTKKKFSANDLIPYMRLNTLIGAIK